MYQHYSKEGGQSNFAPLIFTDMEILNVITGRATKNMRIYKDHALGTLILM